MFTQDTVPPTPPPPPTPPNMKQGRQETLPEVPFSCDKTLGPESATFNFYETTARTGILPLKVVLRQIIPKFAMKSLPARRAYDALGKLRGLQRMRTAYNAGIGSVTPYYTRYVRTTTLEALSAFGFQVANGDEPVAIEAMDDFINAVEEVFAEEIEEVRGTIKRGSVPFNGLQELYLPGCVVAGLTWCGEMSGFRVVTSFYEEKRSLFGFEKSFHLQLEYVASVGTDLAVVSFEDVMSGWVGVTSRDVTRLAFVPATADQIARFVERGERYSQCGACGGPRFLAYAAGTFFMHGGGGHTMSGSTSSQTTSGGRLMVDVARASALGHHAALGGDEASLALVSLTGRYRRLCTDRNSQRATSSTVSESLVLFTDKVPEELLAVTWPTLTGFSFSSKTWGNVLVSGLSQIAFNDSAFDQLVLDDRQKRLVRALVRFGGGNAFSDIISGKSGGSIFLLHGPPGVGKTLTAEAIAEVLHRPLYYVTMGELGTTPESMEQRLRDVLTLCAGWDAITLIDEADVFLEKRSTSDVVRNAMVCVMLRLVEYHPGILFLTSNRVAEFDPAFESRVTVALKYDHLPQDARKKVWTNLISRVPIRVEPLDYDRLAEHVLNGRQIKNAIRLAMALAQDQNSSLTQDLIEETISITSVGRSEMTTADTF